MTIAVGERIPSVQVKRVTAAATEDVDSAVWLGRGRIALFTVPGAFTPTCHNNHLPGFIALADDLRAAGIDRIVCATANDHHVVRNWAEQTGAFDSVEMLADPHAKLAGAMGLSKQFPDLGLRFRRSSLLINHGIVDLVTLETSSGPTLATGAEAFLDVIRARQLAHTA